MKVLFVAINSSYTHSAPAVYALKRACNEAGFPATCQEWSINSKREQVLAAILAEQADVICFSAYIWNIEYLERLLWGLRPLLPQAFLFMGGPQVHGEKTALWPRFPMMDALLFGEGEALLPQLLAKIEDGDAKPALPGLHWRGSETPIEFSPLLDIRDLPIPYTQADLVSLAGHILYYESSRGCPFACSFCASAQEPLRQKPLEMVLADLQQLLAGPVEQIKFVDRTFNADGQRAAAICTALLRLYRPGLSFHFEISPYLLPEALLNSLCAAPAGYFRLEAGVQSLHPPTLAAIHRRGDWPQAKANLRRLLKKDNLHLHLDLIAGLPQETAASFAVAFQELHDLAPHYLQLGFLKVLPGSLLAAEAESAGIRYSPFPPYQVIETESQSAAELLALHGAEEMVDAFYNSGRFRQSLHLAGLCYPGGALALYLDLAQQKAAQTKGNLSPRQKAELLAALFAPLDEAPLLLDALRFDWYCYGNGEPLPPVLQRPGDSRSILTIGHLPNLDAGGLYRFSPAMSEPLLLAFAMDSKKPPKEINSLCAGRYFERIS